MKRALELLKNLFKALIFWFFLPAPALCGDQAKRTVKKANNTLLSVNLNVILREDGLPILEIISGRKHIF
jgi:hypothetical protein